MTWPVSLLPLDEGDLRRYAWTLVGQDAEDVTAEAWLHIARDLRRFVGDLDAFRGWTARILRNRAPTIFARPLGDQHS